MWCTEIVMCALSLTFYEIFENQTKGQNKVKRKTWLCAIWLGMFDSTIGGFIIFLRIYPATSITQKSNTLYYKVTDVDNSWMSILNSWFHNKNCWLSINLCVLMRDLSDNFLLFKRKFVFISSKARIWCGRSDTSHCICQHYWYFLIHASNFQHC